jgi:hypothetical protein
MDKKQSNIDPKQLRNAINFVKGKMKEEAFIKQSIKSRRKMTGMRELVKDPYIFHLFN